MAVYTDPVHVGAVQAAINLAGYQPALAVDGQTGPATSAGVRWFQQQHGLTVDGLIGDQTMAATIAPTPAQIAQGVQAASALVPAIASISPAPGSINFMGPTLAGKGPALQGIFRTAAQQTAASVVSASKIPAWAPPLGFALLGAGAAALMPFLPFVLPLKLAIGGAVGGAIGAGVSVIMHKPATPAVHGEPSFGWDGLPAGHSMLAVQSPRWDSDLDVMYDQMLEDDDIITAGEIGLSAASGLRG